MKLDNRYFLYFFLFYISTLLILPQQACWDIDFWKLWSVHLHDKGFSNAYTDSNINYNPFILYILKLFGKIQGSSGEILDNINFLKAFILPFDIIGAVSIFFLLKPNNDNKLLPFLLLFNAAYLYNTLVWFQVDAVHTTFIVLSLIAALRNRSILAFILFALAFATKVQSVIFLPILILIIIPLWVKSPKSFLLSILAFLAMAMLIWMPFILSGNFTRSIAATRQAVDFYPYTTMNAFNIWYFFGLGEFMKTKDTIECAGFSYKQWGLLMFTVYSFITLLPLFVSLLKSLSTKSLKGPDLSKVFLCSGLIAVCFFYFNTQMHERYSHPCMILFFFYGVLGGSYLLYALSSLAYLLNMEAVQRALGIHNYHTFIFDPLFISSLFLLILVIGVYLLYRESFIFKDIKSIREALLPAKSIRGNTDATIS